MDTIIIIGLSFISILLTISIFILKGVNHRIDEHRDILNDRGKLLREIEYRLTICETKHKEEKN